MLSEEQLAVLPDDVREHYLNPATRSFWGESLVADLADALIQKESLLNDLEQYGYHSEDCRFVTVVRKSKCTCGFASAVEKYALGDHVSNWIWGREDNDAE
jgi:hypothetical protein